MGRLEIKNLQPGDVFISGEKGDIIRIGVGVVGNVNEVVTIGRDGVVDAKGFSFNGYHISAFGFKNKVVNGDMAIAQRGTYSKVKKGDSRVIVCDRFMSPYMVGPTPVGEEVAEMQQMNADGPPDFDYYLRFKVLVPWSHNGAYLRYKLTHNAIREFRHGTVAAKNGALSFWVRSSIAGEFSVSCTSVKPSAENNLRRSIVLPYTINQANTWEFKEIMIPGDREGNRITNWYNDTIVGMRLYFSLNNVGYTTTNTGRWVNTVYLRTPNNVNLTNIVGSTFDLTGVQYEPGPHSTPFERRPRMVDMLLCQQYYRKIGPVIPSKAPWGTDQYFVSLPVIPQMITTPTATVTRENTGFTVSNPVMNLQLNHLEEIITLTGAGTNIKNSYILECE